MFERGKFAGGGPFNLQCAAWLKERFEVAAALPTTSGTHALEMAALLCDLEPGDEVILPSYAFPSTATAFARCGAELVFVDVDPATMNIDTEAVAAAVTDRTRVVVALHYAGVACPMRPLREIARRHGLVVVEDAAHAILAEYDGEPCGALGEFGCFSFHETKNLHCGEGGALLIRAQEHVRRAEIIWEKGTDRAQFSRGDIEKYTWQDIGSSYVMGELNAAFLLAQLERGEEITEDRVAAWRRYEEGLAPLCHRELVELPTPPDRCRHNGHIFWLKTRTARERARLIAHLEERAIQAVFHYQPLHTSVAGVRYGRFHGEDRHTTRDAQRILRLPMYYGIGDGTATVIEAIRSFYEDG